MAGGRRRGGTCFLPSAFAFTDACTCTCRFGRTRLGEIAIGNGILIGKRRLMMMFRRSDNGSGNHELYAYNANVHVMAEMVWGSTKRMM